MPKAWLIPGCLGTHQVDLEPCDSVCKSPENKSPQLTGVLAEQEGEGNERAEDKCRVSHLLQILQGQRLIQEDCTHNRRVVYLHFLTASVHFRPL